MICTGLLAAGVLRLIMLVLIMLSLLPRDLPICFLKPAVFLYLPVELPVIQDSDHLFVEIKEKRYCSEILLWRLHCHDSTNQAKMPAKRKISESIFSSLSLNVN